MKVGVVREVYHHRRVCHQGNISHVIYMDDNLPIWRCKVV